LILNKPEKANCTLSDMNPWFLNLNNIDPEVSHSCKDVQVRQPE